MPGNTSRGRTRRFWLAMVATAAMVAVPFVAAPAPAKAASAAGFDAGNIISDSLFYNGNGMSTSEVQRFLNNRVPRCTIGDSGREAGSKWGSTTIANKCLKDFKVTTSSKATSAYCSAYVGRSGESAAQIISKVAQACGISPQVLLITLEKEQSLVTDSWPTVRQFNVAMGYGCPDTGPGNTANCNSNYYGFFNQVFRAAWQLKVYKAHPNNYNFQKGDTETIQWHPDRSRCGTSRVRIENYATAALYTYTPYRPNQAALNAGWGTGNSCSSYGNRNFYLFYKTWFGDPSGHAVYARFGEYWEAHQARWLGDPTAAAKTLNVNGGGVIQSFDGGGVYLANASGAQLAGISFGSPIMAAFIKAGALEGSWGWPLAPGSNMGSSGNNTMRFTAGTVVEAVGIGAYLIPNNLVPGWIAAGGFTGSWGVPTTESTSSDGFTQQSFTNVLVVRDPRGSVFAVANEFAATWVELGGYAGSLGLPSGEPIVVAGNGGGKRLNFTGGAIFASPRGTYGVGQMDALAAYDAAGGPAGSWGWPVSAQMCDVLGKCAMGFEGGVATWSNSGAPNFIPGGSGTGLVPQVSRIAGANRYATAVAASQHTHESTASTLVIAQAWNYPDALGAGALAVHLDAPLLLTAQGFLPDVTKAEIQRLQPSQIIVTGGSGVVSDDVLATLETYSSEVTRLAGNNRYSTSRAIVEYGWSESSEVFIASGTSYADALSAGAAAGAMDAPVLLVPGQGAIDADLNALLTELGVTKAHLVGGEAVISLSTEQSLSSAGVHSVERYGGQNRYETSAQVANSVFHGQHDVYWAVGTDFADALAGAPVAGAAGSPLMLTRPTCVPHYVDAATARVQPANIVLFGGEGVLSPDVAARRVC